MQNESLFDKGQRGYSKKYLGKRGGKGGGGEKNPIKQHQSIKFNCLENPVINRTCLAGVGLKTALSIIHSFIKVILCKIFNKPS